MSAAPSDESRERFEHSRSCSAGYDFESQCTCGLEYRIQLQTEREMHNAWRKRAEEAEAKLSAAERDTRELCAQLVKLEAVNWDYSDIDPGEAVNLFAENVVERIRGKGEA